MTIRRFIYLPILLFLAINLFGQNQIDQFNAKRLDNLYSTFFQKEGVGCATLIAKNGKVIYEKAFGMADIELNLPAGTDHIFRIGSITKQFTAVAILQLYEQGKIDLNDEIQQYVQDFPVYPKKITIRHLLTHTSGIKNLTDMDSLVIKQTPYSAQELIGLFKDKPLDFEPGEKYSYSNSGYILLGCIIEKVSGKTYADYIKTNIFNQLGMADAYYDSSARIIKNRVKGYDLDSAYQLVNAAWLNTTFPYSAGGLIMTVRDYFKWHTGLLTQQLIKKETLQKAWTPFQLNDSTFTKYGYGWTLGEVLGSKTLEHGGHINGFNCKVTYLPQEDILAVTFSAGSFVNSTIINDQAVAIVANKPQLKNIEISTSAMNAYAGTYKFSPNDPTTIKIYNENGQLYLKDSNAATPWKMYFIKENEFICYEVFPNTHLFSKNEKGEVDFLIIKNFDNETKVRREQK